MAKNSSKKSTLSKLGSMARGQVKWDPETAPRPVSKKHHFSVNARPKTQRKNHGNVTVVFCQPYDGSKHGFRCASYEEYIERSRKSRAEEFECDILDGPDYLIKLYKELEIDQATLALWFSKLEHLPEHEAAYLYGLSQMGEIYPKTAESIGEQLEAMEEGHSDRTMYEGTAVEVAENWSEDGLISDKQYQTYFDYASLGELVVNDGFEPSDDTMTDQEIGEEYVDEVDGGIKNVDKETLKAHFDAEAFARDLDFNGEIHEFDFSGTTYCIT